MNGAQVARMILDRNALADVRVEPVAGELTDHYDPRDRVVRLSEGIYGSTSLAAASVAAHEVGHAIQDASHYTPMRLRSGLLPLAIAGQQLWILPLMLGFALGVAGLVWIAIALYAGAVAFQLITLPVELDASRRAKRQLADMGLVSDGHAVAVMLRSAAMTYVVAAVASVATLLWYLMIARSAD
jgi:Zn-dependent membrane protease YugP